MATARSLAHQAGREGHPRSARLAPGGRSPTAQDPLHLLVGARRPLGGLRLRPRRLPGRSRVTKRPRSRAGSMSGQRRRTYTSSRASSLARPALARSAGSPNGPAKVAPVGPGGIVEEELPRERRPRRVDAQVEPDQASGDGGEGELSASERARRRRGSAPLAPPDARGSTVNDARVLRVPDRQRPRDPPGPRRPPRTAGSDRRRLDALAPPAGRPRPARSRAAAARRACSSATTSGWARATLCRSPGSSSGRRAGRPRGRTRVVRRCVRGPRRRTDRLAGDRLVHDEAPVLPEERPRGAALAHDDALLRGRPGRARGAASTGRSSAGRARGPRRSRTVGAMSVLRTRSRHDAPAVEHARAGPSRSGCASSPRSCRRRGGSDWRMRSMPSPSCAVESVSPWSAVTTTSVEPRQPERVEPRRAARRWPRRPSRPPPCTRAPARSRGPGRRGRHAREHAFGGSYGSCGEL